MIPQMDYLEKNSENVLITQVLSASACLWSCIHSVSCEKYHRGYYFAIFLVLSCFYLPWTHRHLIVIHLSLPVFDWTPVKSITPFEMFKNKLKALKNIQFLPDWPLAPTAINPSRCWFTVKASQQHFLTSRSPCCCACCARLWNLSFNLKAEPAWSCQMLAQFVLTWSVVGSHMRSLVLLWCPLFF